MLEVTPLEIAINLRRSDFFYANKAASSDEMKAYKNVTPVYVCGRNIIFVTHSLVKIYAFLLS